MSTIVVVCPQFLGVSKKYVVRVDGQQVGRLGWRSKQRVAAEVDGRPTHVMVE